MSDERSEPLIQNSKQGSTADERTARTRTGEGALPGNLPRPFMPAAEVVTVTINGDVPLPEIWLEGLEDRQATIDAMRHAARVAMLNVLLVAQQRAAGQRNNW